MVLKLGQELLAPLSEGLLVYWSVIKIVHVTRLGSGIECLLLLNLLLDVLELAKDLIIDVSNLLSKMLADLKNHLHAYRFVCLCTDLNFVIIYHSVIEIFG